MSTGTTIEIIGERIKEIKANQQAKVKHERPPRPEIDDRILGQLEELRILIAGVTSPEEANPQVWSRLVTLLMANAEALLLDARDLRKTREKLSRVVAKSNRRRNQLRQQNTTIELYAANLHNLRRNSVDSVRESMAQQRHILDLQNQLRQERSERRRAEDELYRMRQVTPPSTSS